MGRRPAGVSERGGIRGSVRLDENPLPMVVWTLTTEERKRAGLAGRKYLNGLRFKSAERPK